MTFKTALASLCTLLPTAAALGGGLNLATDRVASGLDRPVFVTHAPGDTDRLFILEQKGVIKILDLNTETILATPFLDINSLVGGPSSSNDERGLLGLAFDPAYAVTGLFYVNYTNNASDTVVAQYTVSADPNIANAGSADTILFIDQPFTNHNGGWIGFSPNDGYLYVATGDGGSACDPGQRAQDITAQLLGKMLRIDPDGVGGYTIPADNPFVGVTGDDEIWALGLRNPWRCAFDSQTGDLWIADVGQNAREEINFQAGDSTGRENYGWDCEEGTGCANSVSFQCGGTANGCACGDSSLTRPIHEYTHALGFSLTGGEVYRGSAIPPLAGTYFFADFVTSRIWSLVYDGMSATVTERTSELSPSIDGFTVSAISSFGTDANGEIYIVDRCSTTCGEIFRLISTGLPCPWDLDGSGSVGTTDLLALLAAWGSMPGGPPDFDGGGVGTTDLLKLLANWGACP